MELNLTTIGYLFFRLAPFILVCFFSLASLFNQDFKGLVYLIGLIITCAVFILFGNSTGEYLKNKDVTSTVGNEICNFVTIGGTPAFGALPISQCIFGYTGAYLMYIIVKHGYVGMNIPTIVFFPLIAAIDGVWNIRNNCYSVMQVIASLAVGISMGCIWAYLISSMGISKLQYFNKISGKDECSRPAKNTFKCNVYKNGKLLSATNMG
jgi:hypothetical protein